MTQAHINLVRQLADIKSAIFDNKIYEFIILFSTSKTLRFYYSKIYKDYVISLSLGNSRNFILTRSMWKQLKPYLSIIENEYDR